MPEHAISADRAVGSGLLPGVGVSILVQQKETDKYRDLEDADYEKVENTPKKKTKKAEEHQKWVCG